MSSAFPIVYVLPASKMTFPPLLHFFNAVRTLAESSRPWPWLATWQVRVLAWLAGRGLNGWFGWHASLREYSLASIVVLIDNKSPKAWVKVFEIFIVGVKRIWGQENLGALSWIDNLLG